MEKRLPILLALIPAVGFGFGSIPMQEEVLVVTNGAVINGTGAPPFVEGTLVIHGNRIVAVGEASAIRLPESARVIDAGGGTILPGIINSHTHATHEPEVRRAFLVDGVTSVCNLGTTLDRLPLLDIASVPEGPVARDHWAGPIITAPGGYPGSAYGAKFNYEVGSPEEARSAVTDLLERGASVIKIALVPHPAMLDLARVRAIVEEAHTHGALVRSHVFLPYLVEEIILPAGVDVIEHLPFPNVSREEATRIVASDEPLSMLFDTIAPGYERLMARVVERGIIIVPTLDGHMGHIFQKDERSPMEELEINTHLEAARRFHALGGTFALGNDYGSPPHVELGMPLVEMELLLTAGLTSMEVIVAGTLHAAQVCGQGDALGSLEVGKVADIIVVDGDPLTDLTAMDRVVAVVKGGVVAYQE
jgi:imidazolonepropionase-like amidohydrolase